MTIQHRDSFLHTIAHRLGRKSPKMVGVERPTYQFEPQKHVLENHSQDQLLDVLEKQCKVIHTDFYRVTKETLAGVLQRVIDRYGAGSIVTQTDERHELFGTETLLKELADNEVNVHFWHPRHGKDNQIIAERANIGLTFSDVTLSESGTVALLNDAYHGRSISLLPRTYIALIPKSTIVPRYTQFAAMLSERSRKGEAIGSCISLVTGPSNSADIEMKLIVGVHGPVEATYIVIEDM